MTLVVALVALIVAAPPSKYDPPKGMKLSWATVFAVPDEGEPMTVTGTVFDKDGKTPLEGAVVYVYHTDADGRYTDPEDPDSDLGIHGWMRTNEDGQYQFTSIRPGGYPSGRVPAHIHFIVMGPNAPERKFEVFFEGDPLISKRTREQANRGGMFMIRPIEQDEDGHWRCNVDLVLSDRSDS